MILIGLKLIKSLIKLYFKIRNEIKNLIVKTVLDF